ncbi:hypothetical protein F5Y09DRAFT_306743 [Xylaria sp. FL1042]|nr:hypothetical protein F5Y09DRAFT_306743 [Xylaria sp. FL1042]
MRDAPQMSLINISHRSVQLSLGLTAYALSVQDNEYGDYAVDGKMAGIDAEALFFPDGRD